MDALELSNCKAQCYDNESVIAGETSGVQQCIGAFNEKLYLLTATITLIEVKKRRCRPSQLKVHNGEYSFAPVHEMKQIMQTVLFRVKTEMQQPSMT